MQICKGYRIGQDWTGRNRMGQDGTGRNRMGQDGTGWNSYRMKQDEGEMGEEKCKCEETEMCTF